MAARLPIFSFISTIFIAVSAAAGEPDVVADCRELASRNGTRPEHLGAFMNACIAFERKCYEVEKAAAKDCGEHGPAEQGGRQSSLKLAENVGKTNPSYTKNGEEALRHCGKVHQFRDTQGKKCAQHLSQCYSITMTTPDGQSFSCTKFGPESSEWSAASKRRPNICSAIQAELARVQDDTKANETQCNRISNIVDNARQREGRNGVDTNRMDRPDPRACGIFGCSKNSDGTYSKNGPPAQRREAPYREPTSNSYEHYQAQSPPQQRREGPTSNQSIRLTVPDPRACGLFGCEENKDGSYSPKYAPNSVDPINDF